jgi:hypothetical protein
MRHLEIRLIDHRLSKQYEIEVEGSRGIDVWPLATTRPLDCQQRLEKLTRGNGRRADGRRIDKARLRTGNTDRIGLVVRRNFQIVKEVCEPGDCEVEMRTAIAEVAAQGDGGNHTIQFNLPSGDPIRRPGASMLRTSANLLNPPCRQHFAV